MQPLLLSQVTHACLHKSLDLSLCLSKINGYNMSWALSDDPDELPTINADLVNTKGQQKDLEKIQVY